MTPPWVLRFTVLYPWFCTILIAWGFGRIWWTAVKTGRWLLGNGRSYHFPSKYYTFSLYDRTSNPFMFKLGVVSIPVLFLLSLSVSVVVSIIFAVSWLHG